MLQLLDLIRSRETFSGQFESAFREQFPDIHENREALELVSLRPFKEEGLRGDIFGLCLKDKDVSLSQLRFALESLKEMPNAARGKLPQGITPLCQDGGPS